MVDLVVVQQRIDKAEQRDLKKVTASAEGVVTEFVRKVGFIETSTNMSAADKVTALEALINGTVTAPKALTSGADVSETIQKKLVSYADSLGLTIDDAIQNLLTLGTKPDGMSDDEAKARLAIAGAVMQAKDGYDIEGNQLAIVKKHGDMVIELEQAQIDLENFKPVIDAVNKYPEALHEDLVKDAAGFVADPGYTPDLVTEHSAYKAALANIAEHVELSRIPLVGRLVRVDALGGKAKKLLEELKPAPVLTP